MKSGCVRSRRRQRSGTHPVEFSLPSPTAVKALLCLNWTSEVRRISELSSLPGHWDKPVTHNLYI